MHSEGDLLTTLELCEVIPGAEAWEAIGELLSTIDFCEALTEF